MCENLLPPLIPHLLFLLEGSDESHNSTVAGSPRAGAVNLAMLGHTPGSPHSPLIHTTQQEERLQATQAVR